MPRGRYDSREPSRQRRSNSRRGRSRSRGARGRRSPPARGNAPRRDERQMNDRGRSDSRNRDNRNGNQRSRSDSRQRSYGGGTARNGGGWGQDAPPPPPQQQQQSARSQEEIMDIPPTMVGRIIGKGGETIMRLQKESGAKIDLNKDQNNLRISGDPRSIDAARRLVLEVIDSHQNSRNDSQQSSRGEEFSMDIPQSMVGKIIGKGGETIKRLRSESGAKMDLNKEQNSLKISGDSQSIKLARDLVLQMLNSAEGDRRDNDYRNNDQRSMKSEETVNFPVAMTGRIIGKGGETIKQIQNDSGARVNVTKEEPGIVRLVGSSDCIERAKSMIYDIMERAQMESRNDDNNGGFGARRPTTSEEVLEVPQNQMGRIIGKGGETIMKLQQDSGARIDIQKDQPGTVRISGSSDCIATAKQMIHSLLEEGQDKGKGGKGGGKGGKSDEVMRIPPQAVGKIIGKGGETIKQLSQESGCRININKDEEPGIVHLMGTPETIAHARRLISGVLEDDVDSVTVNVAPQLVEAFMVGDDLQKIEQQMGVRIQLLTEENPVKVCINGGAPNAVKDAKSMVYDLMERLDFENGPRHPPQSSSWAPPASDDFPPRPPHGNEFPPRPPSMQAPPAMHPPPMQTPPAMHPPTMPGPGVAAFHWPPHLANLADRERMINTMTWPDGTTYAQKEERLMMLTMHMMTGKGVGKRSSGRSSSSGSSSSSPARAKKRPKPNKTAHPQPPPPPGRTSHDAGTFAQTMPSWPTPSPWGQPGAGSWAPAGGNFNADGLDMDEL